MGEPSRAPGSSCSASLSAWLVIRHYEADLPSIADLKGNYNPPQVTRVLARDGRRCSPRSSPSGARSSRSPTLPPHVKLAVLAAEDASFYEHEGLNYFGMLRALVVNLRSGRTRQGGSTITQQVVKNVLLDPERSFRRKMREVILARRLEQQISEGRDPRALPEPHLLRPRSLRHRGGGAVLLRQDRARGQRSPRRRCSPVCPRAPSSTRRGTTRRARKSRRRFVLAQMLDKGFIDQRQHDAAMDEPLRLAPAVEAAGQLAPEVVELVKRTLKEAIGEAPEQRRLHGHDDDRSRGSQAAARKAVRDNLDAYDKRYKLLGPFSPPLVASSRTRRSPSRAKKPFEGTPTFIDHKVHLGIGRPAPTTRRDSSTCASGRSRAASSSPTTSATTRSTSRRASSRPRGRSCA